MKPAFSIASSCRVSVTAAVLVLACAGAPTWAGPVAQIGEARPAIVQQENAGNGNRVLVRQGDNSRTGFENTVYLEQRGVSNAVVDVVQYAFDQATIFQHDGADLQVYINNNPIEYGRNIESNTVTIDQSGLGARAWVDQSGALHRADIVQEGWGGINVAQIRQVGNYHQATISQAGGDKSATIIQNGLPRWGEAASTATIRQGR